MFYHLINHVFFHHAQRYSDIHMSIAEQGRKRPVINRERLNSGPGSK